MARSPGGPDYSISLRYQGGVFRLHMPDLGLTVSDPDLAQAYSALQAERDKILARFTEAGTPFPRRIADAERRAWARFLKRTLLVAAVGLVATSAGAILVSRGISRSVDRLKATADRISIPAESVQADMAQLLLTSQKLSRSFDDIARQIAQRPDCPPPARR